MAPNAAGAFILLGLGLVFVAREIWSPRTISSLAAIVFGAAGMALAGYVTGLRSTFAWWRFTGMALHTAGALLIASATLVGWVVRRTPKAERPSIHTFLFFVFAAITIALVGVIVVVSNQEQQAAGAVTRQSVEVKAGIDRFIAAMARLDAATRNFALTGDEYYAQRVAVHRTAVIAAIDTNS